MPSFTASSIVIGARSRLVNVSQGEAHPSLSISCVMQLMLRRSPHEHRRTDASPRRRRLASIHRWQTLTVQAELAHRVGPQGGAFHVLLHREHGS